MNKVCKKLLLTLTAGVMALSAFSFASCDYTSKALEGVEATDTVSSQGGWVVKKGGYVYFINGKVEKNKSKDENDNEVEVATVFNNEYGKTTRGALMRIKESDMDSDDYVNKAETVVPLLIRSEDTTSGFFIYGDRVYYATPSTAKNMSGEVEADYVDFKSSKLDGSKTMKEYYARSASDTRYRFVEVNGEVYLMYIDTDSNLYSINTKTNKKTMLLRGATGCSFNESDLSDPYAYYTASVYQDIDTRYGATLPYNQVYRVRADAKAEVKNGVIKVTGYTDDYADTTAPTEAETYTYEYTFNTESLKDLAETAEENSYYKGFSAGKIETYPIVNLGQLVLDGIGKRDVDNKTMFSHSETEPDVLVGYSYTVASYKTIEDVQTGAKKPELIYTRTPIDQTGATGETAWAYMYDVTALPSNSDSIAANTATENVLLTRGGGKAGPTSYYYLKNGAVNFLYASGSSIYRASIVDGLESNTVEVAKGTGINVSKFLALDYSTEYKYAYYLNNGGGVVRVVIDSDSTAYAADPQSFYNTITGSAEYKVASVFAGTGLSYSHDSTWYDPEIIDGRLYVMNTRMFADSGISLAEVVKIEGNNKELNEKNEKLEAVMDFFSDASAVSSYELSYYYFYNENTDLYDLVVKEALEKYNTDLFSEKQKQFFQGYVTRQGEMDVDKSTHVDFATALTDGDEYYGLRSYFFKTIGKMDVDEQEFLENVWRASYFSASEIDNQRGEWTVAIERISLGLAIGLPFIAAIALTCVVVRFLIENKKAKKSTGSSNKKKYVVDMTDDASIDVYADENAPESQEQKEEFVYVEEEQSEE